MRGHPTGGPRWAKATATSAEDVSRPQRSRNSGSDGNTTLDARAVTCSAHAEVGGVRRARRLGAAVALLLPRGCRDTHRACRRSRPCAARLMAAGAAATRRLVVAAVGDLERTGRRRPARSDGGCRGFGAAFAPGRPGVTSGRGVRPGARLVARAAAGHRGYLGGLAACRRAPCPPDHANTSTASRRPGRWAPFWVSPSVALVQPLDFCRGPQAFDHRASAQAR
jgi:hypothetical protein